MERRLDPRWPADLEATVVNLAVPDVSAPGRVVNVSESGIGMRLPVQLAPNAVVKVTIGDCTLFGIVVHSCEQAGACEIGIEVARVLIGESDLAKLLNSLLAEAMPYTPGVRAVKAG